MTDDVDFKEKCRVIAEWIGHIETRVRWDAGATRFGAMYYEVVEHLGDGYVREQEWPHYVDNHGAAWLVFNALPTDSRVAVANVRRPEFLVEEAYICAIDDGIEPRGET